MKGSSLKATSPGRRFVTKFSDKNLYKGRPLSSLVVKKSNNAGRNNQGRITVRHKGGGHKRLYRLIDFKRLKDSVSAKVERIEYDPNRTSNIALLCYADGERRYIIAPKDLDVGMHVVSGDSVDIKVGNCISLANTPSGTLVHNVELKPGKGAQLARSAGAYAQVVDKDKKHAVIKLRSGEVRKVLLNCRAVIGTVSNVKHNLESLGKAGAKRWLGIRPTVRGVAMNPIDHPHGGGEGRTSGGRHPVTPWGVQTKGKRTRKSKYSDKFIVQRRNKK